MDQKAIAIKQDIAETRAEMGTKIHMISKRIYDTFVGPKLAADHLIEHLNQAKEAMLATTSATGTGTEPTHPAVAETTKQVEGLFHLFAQTERKPWVMLASVLAMGYVIGSLRHSNVLAIRSTNAEVETLGKKPAASVAIYP